MNNQRQDNQSKRLVAKLIASAFQFAKFAIVGLFNTALNYLIYSTFVFFGLHYLLSNTIAWGIGILISYLLNAKFVFTTPAKASSMVKTYAVYGVSYLVTQLGLVLLVDFLLISEFLAPLIMLLFSIPFNFLAMKFWAMRKTTEKLIVFDLDGTLFATHPGITSSMEAVLSDNGLKKPDEQMLEDLLRGGSTAMLIKNMYGLPEEEIRKVIREYRMHYLQFGIYNCKPYTGIPELLDKIQSKNYMIAIASLKREAVLKELVELKGFASYFKLIIGNDDACTLTKAQILKKIMSDLGAAPKNTVMVGDSYYDYDAAREVGCRFIGVTYGYGFCKEEIIRLDQVNFVENIDKLEEQLKL